MRATQELEIRLFDGECIAQGCRGRRSDLSLNKKVGRWIAAIIAGLMIGFAGAATAIHRYPINAPQQVSGGHGFVLSVASHDDVLW
jgi:hypothetical protein